MHTLPTEISDSIGTSTLFAAWNAAIYVAQVEDDRLGEVVSRRTLSRRHQRGAARAWRALVQRRILRDLAAARLKIEGNHENRGAGDEGSGRAHDAIRTISEFMRGYSVEATRPKADDIAALGGIVPAGTSVYVSAVPAQRGGRSDRARVAIAARRLRAGAASCGAQFTSDVRARPLSGAAGRGGGRAAGAGDRRRPRSARGFAAQRARCHRQRLAAAPRHPRGRHCRLSRRTSAHPGRRARPRACRQDRGRRGNRAAAPHRHAILLRRRSDHRLDRAGCATSATTRRSGSASPARPACRR